MTTPTQPLHRIEVDLDWIDNADLTVEEFEKRRQIAIHTLYEVRQPEPPPTLLEIAVKLCKVTDTLTITIPVPNDDSQRGIRHTLGQLTEQLRHHCTRLQQAEAEQGE